MDASAILRELAPRVRGISADLPRRRPGRSPAKSAKRRSLAPVADAPASRDAAQGVYLDLENPADLEKLDDPGAYLARHRDRLVVLDEIHRKPALFQILRGVIDERIRLGEPTGQFPAARFRVASTCCARPASRWPGASARWN